MHNQGLSKTPAHLCARTSPPPHHTTQDTIQLGPLSLTMTGMMLMNPVVISRVFIQVRAHTRVCMRERLLRAV